MGRSVPSASLGMKLRPYVVDRCCEQKFALRDRIGRTAKVAVPRLGFGFGFADAGFQGV